MAVKIEDVMKAAVLNPVTGSILIYGRLSFPDLFENGQDKQGKPTKCGLTLLLPGDYKLDVLRERLKETWETKFGTDPSKWPVGRDVRPPEDVIRDAREKRYAGYEPGWFFISARMSKLEDRPDVRDRLKPMITNEQGKLVFAPAQNDSRVVYPGRWAMISCSTFAYTNVGKGVSIGLNSVVLDKHDNVLGGAAPRVEADYDGIAAGVEVAEDALG